MQLQALIDNSGQKPSRDKLQKSCQTDISSSQK